MLVIYTVKGNSFLFQQRDEEKASLIAELTAQNSRLTVQLKESSATEAQLMAQLEGLKDQCSMRKTSLQVQFSHS